ncbi:MAG: TonB-dependent siderophore receptor [Caulobacteraceae bacterium]
METAAAASATVEAVVVTANVKKSAVTRVVGVGALGARSVLDTPFSVEAMTSDEIRNLQVKDINGVFRNDASITEVNSSQAQASGAQFLVRGIAMDVLNGYKLDGLALPYWSIDLPIEQFDQVQLFKGATGFMYGFGGPAGIVNFTSKEPTEQQTLSMDVGYRSGSLFGGHVDAGGRVADDRFGYRLNIDGEGGDVYNGGHSSNYSAALALDARITSKLTATFNYFYMKTYQADEVNTAYVGANVTHLATVDGDTNLGARGDWKTNQMNVFTGGLNWDIDNDWKATFSYRHTKLDENFPGNLLTITDNAGDYSDAAFFVRRLFNYDQVQGLIQGHVDAGPLTHNFVFGASEQIESQYSDTQSLVTHPLASGDIYTSAQPTLAGYSTANYHPTLYLLNNFTQGSFFASDTIDWNKWSLLLGARYTLYEDVAHGPTSATTGDFKAYPLSPTVALSYALLPTTRAYVSYVQGLQNGGQATTGTANFGQTFGPIKSTQIETGLKTDHPLWSATAAYFHTKQGADYINGSNVYVQSGEILTQGVEGSATVRPAPAWSVAGSASYLQSTYQQTTAAYIGKDVPGVARVRAAVDVAYLIPLVPGLGVDVKAKYMGKGYGNTANTLAFAAYTTADLGASYSTTLAGQHVTFRAAVKNVLDKDYWVYGASTVIPGEPRTFVLSSHLDF